MLDKEVRRHELLDRQGRNAEGWGRGGFREEEEETWGVFAAIMRKHTCDPLRGAIHKTTASFAKRAKCSMRCIRHMAPSVNICRANSKTPVHIITGRGGGGTPRRTPFPLRGGGSARNFAEDPETNLVSDSRPRP